MIFLAACGYLFVRLKRAAVGAPLGVEILIFDHAETTALLAAAREVFYLDFESRNAVAFRFFFFCHFSFTSFATRLKEDLRTSTAADLRLLPRPDR